MSSYPEFKLDINEFVKRMGQWSEVCFCRWLGEDEEDDYDDDPVIGTWTILIFQFNI